MRLSYSDSDLNGAIDPNSEIIEESNYYPFGLEHKGYNNVVNGTEHPYGFQEQEEQDELGLGWISFKWRNHDPAIGRFMTIDPLTEVYHSWGPYVFSGNRVIDARELEGLEPASVHATMNAAAENFGIYYNAASIRLNQEYGSTIYEVVTSSGTQYAYSAPNIGTSGDSVIPSAAPAGATATGDIHTHAAYDARYANNIFSGIPRSGLNTSSTTGDVGDNNRTGLVGYLTTPNGSLQKYDPISGIISTLLTNLPSDPNDPARLNTVPIRVPVTPVPRITPAPITPLPTPAPSVTPLPPIPRPVPTPSPRPSPIIIPPIPIKT